jgi:sarcosine oxidase subunit beta
VSANPDVLVVGAGVTGLSIAWHLLGRGASVTIVERSGIGAGASGVQPGGVRQQWSVRVSCELAQESIAFYRDIAAELEPRTNPVLDRCGYLFVADSHEELARLEASVAVQNEVGVPSRIVSAAEAAEIVPGLVSEGIAGAAYCAEDGYFDQPQAVVEAFADSVVRRGGEIAIGRVERLVPGQAHWNAELADGRVLTASHVVVAAGADTSLLVERLGVELPITAEVRYLFLSEPISERLLDPLVVAPERHFAAKQLANGRVLASDLGAEGDPAAESVRWRANVAVGIRSLVPILEYVSFPLLIDGVYDVTPDHQPILDAVSDREGLWVAAGFSGHGFMIAPAVGRLVATALGGSRDPRLDHFQLERFARSAIVRETQVV